MMKPAVVIVVAEWPKGGAGGPQGYAYLLLKALKLQQEHVDYCLYTLSTASMKLIPLEQCFGSHKDQSHYGTWEIGLGSFLRTKVWLKMANSPWRILRNACTLARKSKDAWQVHRIRVMIESLLKVHGRVILHGHYVESSHKVLAASKALKAVAVVHTEHSKGGMVRETIQSYGEAFAKDLNLCWLRDQYRDVFELSTAMIFPSAGSLKLFEEQWEILTPEIRRKVIILHSGVSAITQAATSRIENRYPNKLFVVAMHVHEKGIDRIIRAIAECRDQGVELKLRIAGRETALSRDLMSLRENLKLTQNVEFIGSVPHEHILQEMLQADLYLACPRIVVFDLSLLEAMAAGRPILTTRLAGNVEALGSDYPGYFVNDEELAPTLIRILGEPELLDRMGKMNKARFEKEFTLEAMGDRHLSIYSSILHDLAQKSHDWQVSAEVLSL